MSDWDWADEKARAYYEENFSTPSFPEDFAEIDALAAALREARAMGPEWQDISTAPESTWLLTWRRGEKGVTVSAWRSNGNGGKEWIEFGSGRTTITHSTYAAPTHWQPLPAAPKES